MKEKLIEKAYIISSDFNDKELDYIIKELIFWKKERKMQNNEIESIKKRLEKIEENEKI